MIDDWPTDEEMNERCGCSHTLGQHEYGTDLAPCSLIECLCKDFHSPGACLPRMCNHMMYCVIDVGHPPKTRAVWRDRNQGTTVCERHKEQYAERSDLGPFSWEPILWTNRP